ncbi:hypothetical protein RM530_10140 [Algiphilus sp. W345]|uniref:Uncharacterized protein n=1 Tax=Banduia mediterranea TaxID=3075609 RepID=A0ABU2WIM1_9GAMM|nr:hypothetical protein [Algiphilus sp. W345]MDT0497721.1 hypothetical protein [Algiphilus sp. W345]
MPAQVGDSSSQRLVLPELLEVFLEHRLIAIAGHAPGLGGAHIVDGQIHLGDDVEAVGDIQRPGAVLGDQLEAGLPHVRADELDPERLVQRRWMTTTRNWTPIGAVTLNPERDSVVPTTRTDIQLAA